MTEMEKKDLYIAAGVGGLALVVIFAIIHASGPQVLTPADTAAQLPTADGLNTPLPSAYNYNVVPYQPAPLAKNAPVVLGQPAVSGGGDCCCDDCGVSNGAEYNNPNVQQFQTLIQGLTFQQSRAIQNTVAPVTANVPASGADYGGSVIGTANYFGGQSLQAYKNAHLLDPPLPL